MNRRSLRARILLAFGAVGVLYAFLAAGLLVATYEAGQESVAQKMLVGEVLDYLQRRETDPRASLPRTRFVRSYVGDELPAHYQDHLDRFEEEDYDIPLREWREIQLWQDVDASGEPLYVVLDFGVTADAAIRDPNLVRLFLVWLPLLAGVAAWLGWLLSRRLSAPLSRLTHEVTAYDPARASAPIEIEGDREVETLARAFSALRERIERFAEREREFTRFAGHELRTPITVARGAAEILRRALHDPSPKAERALQRLEQATQEMSTTVELFLWLAREESAPRVEDVCETGEIVREIVDMHRPLLEGRSVEVDLRIEAERQESFPGDLFRIAASNLIRNAFQYTIEGSVEIVFDEESLRIVDTGKGMPEELLRQVRRPLVRADEEGLHAEGSGLGVAIVDRIAARCGWRLTLESKEGRGTFSKLDFTSNDRSVRRIDES